MESQDENQDEIRLSRLIVDRFNGRFELIGDQGGADTRMPVDVAATNERLVLGGMRLDQFSIVEAGDRRVPRLADIAGSSQGLNPREIVLLLLCGGMSFRSSGSVHPLREVSNPAGGPPASLLARQLGRLAGSELGETPCFVVGTPLNRLELESHLADLGLARRYPVYAGGLAPRLSVQQHRSGPVLVVRDDLGRISYNPLGHLEALRWFVLGGMLSKFLHSKVVITVSYSNWGRIFTGATLSLAALVRERSSADPNVLFLVEVVPVPYGRERGSILVDSAAVTPGLRLIKDNYGRGIAQHHGNAEVLLSTNTIYFSVPALIRRLEDAGPTVGLANNRESLETLLDAGDANKRAQLAALFEAAFPVEPQLIFTHAGAGRFLRAERDLDQLTLLPGPSLMEAVEVGLDRAVFLKLPSDFENPAKLAYLFER